MRFLRRSLTGIFLLSLTVALLAWAGNTIRGAVQARLGAETPVLGQRERVMSVNIVTPPTETITPELQVFGELRSRRTLVLRAPVAGTVAEADAAFVEGGQVSAGQVLVRLDPVEAQAALDRVGADLQDAEAELREAQAAQGLAQDEVTGRTEQATLRQQALTRARDLATRGVGTAAAVESAELDASSASAAVLSSRQAQAQSAARADQAATQLSRAQIALAEAQRNVDDMVITAAFDGTLSGVTLSLGGRVGANEQIAELVDPAALEVAFRLSTAQYARLLDGAGQLRKAPVRVALEVSDVALIATGQIVRESAGVGEGQTGRQLFATLDTAPGLRPGDFVTVRITEPALDNVARLPATALAADQTVLVVGDEDRLEVVPIVLLRRQDNDVIVSAEGVAGRAVVAERSPLIGAGIKVNPMDPNAAPETVDTPVTADLVQLDPERRAKLIAFVTDAQMPPEAKARILSQLEEDAVPAETIARLESRMGT